MPGKRGSGRYTIGRWHYYGSRSSECKHYSVIMNNKAGLASMEGCNQSKCSMAKCLMPTDWLKGRIH